MGSMAFGVADDAGCRSVPRLTIASMRLTVNDTATELKDGATIVDLLVQLALPGTRVAVEVNRRLVRRADHAATTLHDGDVVEVVTLVGGG
jgi:thiamine biosynthesis protein ThiS